MIESQYEHFQREAVGAIFKATGTVGSDRLLWNREFSDALSKPGTDLQHLILQDRRAPQSLVLCGLLRPGFLCEDPAFSTEGTIVVASLCTRMESVEMANLSYTFDLGEDDISMATPCQGILE